MFMLEFTSFDIVVHVHTLTATATPTAFENLGLKNCITLPGVFLNERFTARTFSNFVQQSACFLMTDFGPNDIYSGVHLF